jgi:hypothetical protein
MKQILEIHHIAYSSAGILKCIYYFKSSMYLFIQKLQGGKELSKQLVMKELSVTSVK